MTRRELEQRVIETARGHKSAMVSGRRFDDWCRQMEESIAALDAAPDGGSGSHGEKE